MKRLLWLVLLGSLVVVTLPLMSQNGAAGPNQNDGQSAKKHKHRRHHKNHHKGHIKPDQYPKSSED